jgi:hypothetical protein
VAHRRVLLLQVHEPFVKFIHRERRQAVLNTASTFTGSPLSLHMPQAWITNMDYQYV